MFSVPNIGQRIKALRERRGVTQRQLAAAVGISQGSLSLIESSETRMPAADTLAKICRHLETTPDFLLAGAGDSGSIDAAIKEHELVFLWRDLPPEARELVLESARATKRAFSKEKA